MVAGGRVGAKNIEDLGAASIKIRPRCVGFAGQVCEDGQAEY